MNSYRCIKFQVNFRQKLKDFYKQAEHLIWKLKNHPYLPSTNTNVNDKKNCTGKYSRRLKNHGDVILSMKESKWETSCIYMSIKHPWDKPYSL